MQLKGVSQQGQEPLDTEVKDATSSMTENASLCVAVICKV
jgi:hypothetical protein